MHVSCFSFCHKISNVGHSRHHVSNHPYTHLGESPKSGLEIRLLLQRRLSVHVTQTLIPSAMLVCISWLSLFIPPDLVPGRMALCVTTLLTLVTMFGSTTSTAPSTAHLKSSDIWMFGCLFTVFTILSEYCVVLYLRGLSKIPEGQSKDLNKLEVAWKVIFVFLQHFLKFFLQKIQFCNAKKTSETLDRSWR